MKSLTDYLSFEVPARRGFVNITDAVDKLVRKSGVAEGLCLVNTLHITPQFNRRFRNKGCNAKAVRLF